MSATSAPATTASVAQPGAGSNSQPTPEQELAQIDLDLKPAEQLAADAESKRGAYETAEQLALNAIYDIWKDKEHRIDLLKPYCANHGIKWDERMRNNRFLPVLLKMFPNTPPPMRSIYSGAMAYAWEQKTPTNKLEDFFKKHGNVQDTCKAYNAIKAQRKVASQAASLPGAVSPMMDNLQHALELMLSLTYSAKITTKETNGRKVKDEKSRHFLVRNQTASDGRVCGVVETAIAEYTAPASRMTFDDAFPELRGIAYVLVDTQVDAFVALYPHHKPWTITADAVEIVLRAANGSEIKGVALGPQHQGLRVLEPLRNPTERMFSTNDQMAGFKGWYKEVTGKAKEQYRRLMAQSQNSPNILERIHAQRFVTRANPFSPAFIPRALDFNVHSDSVTLGFNRSRLRFNSTWLINVVHAMFSTTQPVDVLRERRLLLNHALKLFVHLSRHPAGEGAMFYLADTDEPQGAFVCELPLNAGEFIVAYPTVLNAEMQQRCILDDIEITKLANTGLVISAVAQSAPTPAPSKLRDQMANTVCQQFGAYIVCFRPADDAMWHKRRAAFAKQLTEWMEKADIHLHVRLSGWSKADVSVFEADFDGLLAQVVEFDGTYSVEPGAPLIHNRIECLKAFYASTYDWGIMMDDDAVLYDQPQHNSSWKLFPEMAKTGPAAYAEVDVFFPNNPGKLGGGFNVKYAEDPQLYSGNHVFERNPDLKGSMFIVRNFRKAQRHEVLPDPAYLLHGEDTLFATEAIKQGCTVMKCWNINLHELINDRNSHFAKDRTRKMIEAHKRIAEMYKDDGLRMKYPDDEDSKTLERKEFYENCWKARPKKWSAPKPYDGQEVD